MTEWNGEATAEGRTGWPGAFRGPAGGATPEGRTGLPGWPGAFYGIEGEADRPLPLAGSRVFSVA